MRKLAVVISNIPEIVGGLTMLAIAAILFASVVWRYFFLSPLIWSDEINRTLFVWLVFIGAAVGVKRHMHSTVSLLSAHLADRGRRITRIIGLAAVGIMASVLSYKGATETVTNFSQIMPVTGLSRGWLYLAVPVSGLLMLVYLVPQLRDTLRGVPPPVAHDHHIGGE